MDYDSLKKFSIQILEQADQQSLSYNLYWYSPETRKLRPESKIGYYDKQPSGVSYNHGCKLVITFPRLAFNSLESIINTHLTQDKQIAYREDYKSSEGIGFDVYQRVEELKLFIEPDNVSSKKFTCEGMLKKGVYWADRQLKALEAIDPPLSPQQISQTINEVSNRFNKALAYLKSQGNPQATLRVRRDSGFRHRMIRVNP
ncbi:MULTISPECIES: hypothetical protein [unclassified Acinetobacter]|uniref:hypothetical protein n=1 Tax=unclassified Acinetobacter TaxID=196816 RepID=UPI0015D34895|nr:MULTISPECIES: hypothetical protein [unclassified Acinetobacter]